MTTVHTAILVLLAIVATAMVLSVLVWRSKPKFRPGQALYLAVRDNSQAHVRLRPVSISEVGRFQLLMVNSDRVWLDTLKVVGSDPAFRYYRSVDDYLADQAEDTAGSAW